VIANKRFKCRSCGAELPAWLPVAEAPDGAMLLGHLSRQHPDRVGPSLERMRTEDIAAVAAGAFAVIEGDDDPSHDPPGRRQAAGKQ